jgi:hypothetical protein
MLAPETSVARPSYARKKRKECAYRHVAEGGKVSYAGEMKLTEAGQFYKDHSSLEGYQEKKPNKDSGSPTPSRQSGPHNPTPHRV